VEKKGGKKGVGKKLHFADKGEIRFRDWEGSMIYTRTIGALWNSPWGGGSKL